MIKIELEMLDDQADLILESLKFYGYTLNSVFSLDKYEPEIKKQKRDKLKYTYEQLSSSITEQKSSKRR